MNTTSTRALWVAYGSNGVVGSVRHSEDGYVVVMAGADSEAGTYPDLQSAKGALYARMIPGSDWPRFSEH